MAEQCTVSVPCYIRIGEIFFNVFGYNVFKQSSSTLLFNLRSSKLDMMNLLASFNHFLDCEVRASSDKQLKMLCAIHTLNSSLSS